MDIPAAVYQYLRKAAPLTDWSLGSAVRELVAAPMVRLAEYLSGVLITQQNSIDITALLQNPEANTDAIDAMYTALNLESNINFQPSYGTARIYVDNGSMTTSVREGTVLSTGNTSLTVSHTITASYDPDTTKGEVPYTQVGVGVFFFDVPVSSIIDGGSVAEDTVLVWSAAPSHVYDIRTIGYISGGVNTFTPEDKAHQIYDSMFPGVFRAADSLLKALRVYDGTNVKDLVLMAANGINSDVNVVLKLNGGPTVWELDAFATVSDGLFAFDIPSSGVLNVKDVKFDTFTVQDITTITGTWTLNITGGVPSAVADGVYKVRVSCYGYKAASDIAVYLQTYSEGTPVNFNILMPRLFELRIEANVAGPSSSSAVAAVTDVINSTGLNTSRITDTVLNSILEPYGMILSGPASYILKDVEQDGYSVSASSPDVSPFGVSTIPYAIFTVTENIKFNYV